MKKSLKRLDTVHRKLLETVEPLDSRLFIERPSEGEWSVAEIVQHLYLVEDRVVRDLKRAIDAEPDRVSFLKKLIPTSIVSLRVRKFQAPKAVKPVEVPAKDQVLANFNTARQSLKDLCRSQSRERFKTLVFRHPFLGRIDGNMTVAFVGYHEQRHLKQIREVLKKLGG